MVHRAFLDFGRITDQRLCADTGVTSIIFYQRAPDTAAKAAYVTHKHY